MLYLKKLTLRALSAAVFAVGMASTSVLATPQAVYQSNNSSASAFDANVVAAAASNDIVKAGSATLASAIYSSGVTLSPTFSNVGLHDGSAAGNSNYAYHSITGGAGALPVDYTFNLNGPSGYDISAIQSVAGWNDSQLGDQNFNVFIKTVSNPSFVQLGGDFRNAPFTAANLGPFVPNSTMTTITDSTGLLATGVTAIKFHLFADNFAQVTSNGSSQGTLYRDIAVTGIPSNGAVIPPPLPTFMPLGDSITEGRGGNNGVANIPGGYRDPLYTKLHDAGRSFNFVGSSTSNSTPTLTNAGQSAHNGYAGYRIDQLASNIDGWLAATPASNILLMIGTNDITQHYDPTAGAPGTFEQHAANRLISLINQIYLDEPNATVFLSTIIPILTTANDANSRWAPSVNVSAANYNQLIETQVVPQFKLLGKSIYFVDNYSAFLNNDGSTNLNYYPVATDDEHPNATGYAAMSQTWANAILAVPEPGSVALCAVFVGFTACRRKHNKK